MGLPISKKTDIIYSKRYRISVLKMTQFQIVFSGNMVSTEDLGM